MDLTPGAERCSNTVIRIVHRMCNAGWGKEWHSRRWVHEVSLNTTGREGSHDINRCVYQCIC